MKSNLILTLSLIGSVLAEPVLQRPHSSPRNLISPADAKSVLVSRSISSNPVSFVSVIYDYLVVGGGTAGLALAARLSESGRYVVGVLEAGTSGLGVSIIDIPGDYGLDIGSIYDCASCYLCYDGKHIQAETLGIVTGNYTTVPGSGANAGVPSGSWPRGKVSIFSNDAMSAYLEAIQVLGGSSALNFMFWDRASSVEYDAWEKLGNKGWVGLLPKRKHNVDPYNICRTGNPCTLT